TKSRRPKEKDTEIPRSSVPSDPTNVAYEVVIDEPSMQLKELMDFCTKLQQRVLDMENTKTVQVGLSRRVRSSDEASLGDQEDASKQGRKINDIDKDAEVTLVDETQGRCGDDLMFDTGVLNDEEVFAGYDMAEKKINVAEKEVSTADPVTTAGEIRSAKSKINGVVIGEQSESTTRTRPQQLPSKDKGKGIMEEPKKPTNKKDQISHDEEVAQRLQAQMQAELEEEDRLVRQREEEANIVSWDNVQAMIDVDYQMAQQMQAEEQEKLSIEEKSKLFELVEGSEVRAEGSETRAKGSSKRAGKGLEQEKEVAIDAIPLATKPPSIVDYKFHKEGNKNYYSKYSGLWKFKDVLVFSHMPQKLDTKEDWKPCGNCKS
ncbi:hypothetical protein Tco_0829201, partial [Tanacetum coccineum]